MENMSPGLETSATNVFKTNYKSPTQRLEELKKEKVSAERSVGFAREANDADTQINMGLALGEFEKKIRLLEEEIKNPTIDSLNAELVMLNKEIMRLEEMLNKISKENPAELKKYGQMKIALKVVEEERQRIMSLIESLEKDDEVANIFEKVAREK